MRKIVSIIVIVFILYVIGHFSEDEEVVTEPLDVHVNESITETPAPTPREDVVATYPVQETEEFITATEKEWRDLFPSVYNRAKQAIFNEETQFHFRLDEIHPEDLLAMLEEMITNSRRDTYITQWQYETYGMDGTATLIYEKSPEERAKERQWVQEKVKEIVQEKMHPSMSDREKVRAAHDYLVLHTAYKEEALVCEGCYPDVYTAYGALFHGEAVCDGYTKAMVLLLDAVGIENYYVVGEGNGQAHSWNLVKVDDTYAHVDVTWDDPIPDRPGKISYDYFLVPENKLYGHAWVVEDYPRTSTGQL